LLPDEAADDRDALGRCSRISERSGIPISSVSPDFNLRVMVARMPESAVALGTHLTNWPNLTLS